jgi:hypothetical protein
MSKQWVIRLTILSCLLYLGAAPSIVAAGWQPARAATASSASYSVFLPLTRSGCHQPNTIQGIVNFQGEGDDGYIVRLRFYNGAAWSTLAETLTQGPDTGAPFGAYYFTNVPPLAPGQKYYVLYVNGYPSGVRLGDIVSFWAAPEIKTFEPNECYVYNDIELEDDNLNLPTASTTIALPYTFTWNPRLDAPQDQYQLELFDPADGAPYFATPVLERQPGNSQSWPFLALPPGFSALTWYVWDVWAFSPDGGMGLNGVGPVYVRFSSSAAGASITSGRPLRAVLPVDWIEHELEARRGPATRG